MFARKLSLSSALGALFLVGSPDASAQCDLAWQSGLEAPFVYGSMHTGQAFNTPFGTRFFVGGVFLEMNGLDVHHIAAWDGTTWHDMPGVHPQPAYPTNPTSVEDMLEWDDGNGTRLFVAGSFTRAGSVDSGAVAAWTGTHWVSLGGGLPTGVPTYEPVALSLALFDDGSGDALYAGGSFHGPFGTGADHVARWDGNAWSSVGQGLDGSVYKLTTHDDGSGTALYAAGGFTLPGTTGFHNVARFDGVSWQPVGLGASGYIWDMEVYGGALFVAGEFEEIDGVPASNVARWDGNAWTAVSSGVNGPVNGLHVFDAPGGPVLYAAGDFTEADGLPAYGTAQWDGLAWRQVGDGVSVGHLQEAEDFAVFDAGSGNELHVLGSFETVAGGFGAQGIAKKTLTGIWQPIQPGFAPNDTVRTMVVWDDGSGPALFVAGDFSSAGDLLAGHVAKYDGETWSALGEGVDGRVNALAVFDDGSGEALYVGGDFDTAGGVPMRNLARWNGTTWEDFSAGGTSGENDVVSALYAWDGLGGDTLYVGGRFDHVGGTSADSVATWDGTTWRELGNGVVTSTSPFLAGVEHFVGWHSPTGTRLFVLGDFDVPSAPTAWNYAAWDGTNWSPLDDGFFGQVIGVGRDALVWDDGDGEALFIAGNGEVRRYDGTDWESYGQVSYGSGLAVWDDGSGSGEALYLAHYAPQGPFDGRVSRWTGQWTAVGRMDGSPRTLETFDDGSGGGASLFAGGLFSVVEDEISGNLAELGHACGVWSYCETSPNSAGPGATLSSNLETSVAANDFRLDGVGGVPGQFGLYYYGPSAASVPFGDGVRCVNTPTFRLNPPALFNAAGELSRTVDLEAPPASSGQGEIAAGSTWYFQLWYRDPFGPGGSGFNLSDGLRVVFEP